MRRNLRRVFDVLAALSLLLCAATCVMWVRSYRVSDTAWATVNDRLWRVWSRSGEAKWQTVRPWPYHVGARSAHAPLPAQEPGGPEVFICPSLDGFEHDWSQLGVRGSYGVARTEWDMTDPRYAPDTMNFSGPMRYGYVWVPYWMLAVATAALPAWRVVSHLVRRRRPASGHCTKCGYDLRATPDRCPECGAVAPVPPAREASNGETSNGPKAPALP